MGQKNSKQIVVPVTQQESKPLRLSVKMIPTETKPPTRILVETWPCTEERKPKRVTVEMKPTERKPPKKIFVKTVSSTAERKMLRVVVKEL